MGGSRTLNTSHALPRARGHPRRSLGDPAGQGSFCRAACVQDGKQETEWLQSKWVWARSHGGVWVTRISLPLYLPYVHTACLPSKPRTISIRQRFTALHSSCGRKRRPLLFLKLQPADGLRQCEREMRPRQVVALQDSPMPTPANWQRQCANGTPMPMTRESMAMPDNVKMSTSVPHTSGPLIGPLLGTLDPFWFQACWTG